LPRIVATPDVRIATPALTRADAATLLAIASRDRRNHMELDAAAMRETERERLRSLVQADMDIAAALHADDYQLITPRGYAMSKQEYLGQIASGRLRSRVYRGRRDGREYRGRSGIHVPSSRTDPVDGGQPGLGEQDAELRRIGVELLRLDAGERPSVAESGS
jgi:Domain of unknown function (DUF4440)